MPRRSYKDQFPDMAVLVRGNCTESYKSGLNIVGLDTKDAPAVERCRGEVPKCFTAPAEAGKVSGV